MLSNCLNTVNTSRLTEKHRALITNQVNNQSLIPSSDVIQLTLALKMTTAQFVETSVSVNNNNPIQDYGHPYDHTQPTYKVVC